MEHLIWNLGAFLRVAWLYLTTRDLLIGLMTIPDFRMGMLGGEKHATAIDICCKRKEEEEEEEVCSC